MGIGWRPSAASTLAALLATAGTTHFVAPGFYDSIVPRVLPGSARSWTLMSGAAELACAAAVANRRTRRVGATLAAVLFVVVFPANLQMAVDSRGASTLDQFLAWGRLPLQLPLVWWALRVRRGAARIDDAAAPS
jgi:uncharacterized membrane protein